MKDYLKFLRRLPRNLQLSVVLAAEKIAENKLKDLDVKLLSGQYRVYRCRVGKIRILFQKRDDINFIMDIGFRGDVYKDL